MRVHVPLELSFFLYDNIANKIVIASEKKTPVFSEGIEQAYTVAETLRKYLVCHTTDVQHP